MLDNCYMTRFCCWFFFGYRQHLSRERFMCVKKNWNICCFKLVYNLIHTIVRYRNALGGRRDLQSEVLLWAFGCISDAQEWTRGVVWLHRGVLLPDCCWLTCDGGVWRWWTRAKRQKSSDTVFFSTQRRAKGDERAESLFLAPASGSELTWPAQSRTLHSICMFFLGSLCCLKGQIYLWDW